MPRTLLLLPLILSACVDSGIAEDTEILSDAITIPPRGEPDTLDVGEWNIEFFGSTSQGPDDEALQLARVRDVLAGSDLDLWALEEVVSRAQFDQLVAQVPGYDGFLANDARVLNGSAFYSAGEQKVGILFKSSVITVHSARLVVTGNNFDFGGRPPLEVAVTATIDGHSLDFTFLVLHAKALADSTSYDRRVAGSVALKAFLDAEHPSDPVLLAGDVNDDIDVSISGGRVSPYQNFLDDAAHYTFVTKKLTDAHERTTVSHPETIDHHLATNELRELHIDGSAAVYRVDQFIPQYGTTTSDHFPTLTQYELGGPGGQARLVINEILANELGASTAGEFVEIVNVGGTPASLSGCTLSDGAAVRHTFANFVLAPGKPIVIYGGLAGIPFPIIAVPASSGSLGLDNGGDTVTLQCAGSVVDHFTYTSVLANGDGVSMNRNPDASALGSFVVHTTVGAGPSSPGRRADGSRF